MESAHFRSLEPLSELQRPSNTGLQGGLRTKGAVLVHVGPAGAHRVVDEQQVGGLSPGVLARLPPHLVRPDLLCPTAAAHVNFVDLPRLPSRHAISVGFQNSTCKLIPALYLCMDHYECPCMGRLKERARLPVWVALHDENPFSSRLEWPW